MAVQWGFLLGLSPSRTFDSFLLWGIMFSATQRHKEAYSMYRRPVLFPRALVVAGAAIIAITSFARRIRARQKVEPWRPRTKRDLNRLAMAARNKMWCSATTLSSSYIQRPRFQRLEAGSCYILDRSWCRKNLSTPSSLSRNVPRHNRLSPTPGRG